MILNDFKDITGYDIRSLIEGGVEFITKKYPIYRNLLISGQSYSKYLRDIENWLLEYDRFQLKLKAFSINLDQTEFWDMLLRVDELWSFMKVCGKLGKFLRVIELGSGVTSDRVLRENQNLESLGYETGNEWEDLAISNSLTEEGYSQAGGNILRTPTRFYFGSQNIESCVVPPEGDEIYGRDIQKEFRFSESDIYVLGTKETLRQICGILIGLVKGAIPENRSIGIGNQDFIGTTAGFSYPIILRQVADSFRIDDSFSSVGINSIGNEDGKVFIEFSIETRLGEMVNIQRKL